MSAKSVSSTIRPFQLRGHARPLTHVRFNNDGDLLMTTCKEGTSLLWSSYTGELLGSYEGHGGVVWSFDFTSDSRKIITASGDMTSRLWDTETGKELHMISAPSTVSDASFSVGNKMFFIVTVNNMNQHSSIVIYDATSFELINRIELPRDLRFTCALWADCNTRIIASLSDHTIVSYNVRTGETTGQATTAHKDTITDMQMSHDGTYFITSSRDMTAKIFDIHELSQIRVYTTDSPLNSASIDNIKGHIFLGGGQDASQVTTTHARSGKFETRIYHEALAEELGRVRGHFGPINTLHVSPQGTHFATGGEDGFVRLHEFDQNYHDFKIEFDENFEPSADVN
ncbi:hypothetical protein H696_03738 [Fonticula alba]|uniref:Serine-threonine kinase receptor-associated protein n=1 Tax=Fonticula alba TaxID=691883 RepID=A0A058Z5A1_FONAL|nr:hypothetical protein H696_03738 [Fonticula alba]KCV69306.1 hypothetical protein H696_03738 [Fonticula alba]|eukprot:XP_009495871.1 hypothetical protein H696_03738 [Fonticula alba]